jgi:hypothetical protein
MNRDERRENEQQNDTTAMLIATFVALIAYPILSIVRFLDNNTLTSWKWTVPQADVGGLFLLMVPALALSAVLSAKPIPERSESLVLVLISFFAAMPLWTVPEVNLDASRYFLQAKHLELYGIGSFFREWGHAVGAWTDLPLIPFLYGLIFKYCGEVRLYLQLFTTLLFALTVLLTYCIGKLLWNREIGLYAGLLLLGMPYLLTQVPLMLVDVPLMFFLTLSVYVFLTALERGGRLRIVAASLSLFLCLLAKYSAVILLLVMPVILFVSYQSDPRRKLARAAAVLAGTALLCGLYFAAQHDVVMIQIDLLRTYQWQGLKRWEEGLASTLLFQVHPLITIAASFGVVAAIRKRDLPFLIPAWFAVFVLLFQHGRIRYLLPLFPLLALMAAYGIRELRNAHARRFLVLSIVASSLVLSVFAYAPFLRRASMVNLRDAGRAIDALDGSEVEVRVLPQARSLGNTEMAIPLLDLYTRKKIVYTERLPVPQDYQATMQSPLRFSWETPLPVVYAGQKRDACLTVVVISGDPAGAVSSANHGDAALTLLNRFESTTGVFKYKTMVAVFKRTCMAERAQ